MYRVRFYSNGIEVGPYIDYGQLEHAERAAARWNETFTTNGFVENHTTTITKI